MEYTWWTIYTTMSKDIAGYKRHFLICLKGVGGCKIIKNLWRYPKMDFCKNGDKSRGALVFIPYILQSRI